MSKTKAKGKAGAAAVAGPAVCTQEEVELFLSKLIRADPAAFVGFVEEQTPEGEAKVYLDHERLIEARDSGLWPLLHGMKPKDVDGRLCFELEFYDKISAIKELAKLKGWYKPEKHEHSGRVDLAGLSDAELAAEAAALGLKARAIHRGDAEHAEKGKGVPVGTATAEGPGAATAEKAEQPKAAEAVKPVRRRL